MVNGINNFKQNNNKHSSFPNKNNAIVDSGASGHYFPINSPQHNSHKTNTQFTITQPNGEKLVSTQEATLNILSTLPAAAKEVQIFNNIKYPLISVAKLCDVDCNVLFSKNKVTIEHNNKIIAEAPRDKLSNLWTMPLENLNDCNQKHDINFGMNLTPKETINNNVNNLIQFLYGAAGWPVISTLIKAIKKGYFATWPGLTVKRVRKYADNHIFTAKGHMHLKRQTNKHKTRIKECQPAETDEAMNPKQEKGNNKTHQHFAKIIDTGLIGLCGTDQTGKLPTTSRRGHKYLFVLYSYDPNSILIRPMKSRDEKEFLRVHDEVIEYLEVRGLKPSIQRLDNEASKAYKHQIKNHNMQYELTPAQIHRRNIAERAIQTFKNHFITILAGVDSKFPKNEWDKLLPQAEITINLLRSSRINPNLSAYEQMEGTFDYNKTPLAPLGIKTLAYEMPNSRASWAEHGKEGWYVGPAMEHYQCYEVLIKATKGIRTPPSVKFFPEHSEMPHNSSADRILEAAKQLTHALNNPAPAVPFEHVGDKDVTDLQKLAEIFSRKATQQVEQRNNTNNTSFQRVGDTDNIRITRSHKHQTTTDSTPSEPVEPGKTIPEQQNTDNSVQRVTRTSTLL